MTENVWLENMLIEIMGHLGTSITQGLPTDDQIIAGHIRDAHQITKQALRLLRESKPRAIGKLPAVNPCGDCIEINGKLFCDMNCSPKTMIPERPQQ